MERDERWREMREMERDDRDGEIWRDREMERDERCTHCVIKKQKHGPYCKK